MFDFPSQNMIRLLSGKLKLALRMEYMQENLESLIEMQLTLIKDVKDV
jgi:hypothetical protein